MAPSPWAESVQPTHPKICTSCCACGSASVCIYHKYAAVIRAHITCACVCIEFFFSAAAGTRICGSPLPIPPKFIKSSFKLHSQLLLLPEVGSLEPRTGECSQTTPLHKTGRKIVFSNSNPNLDSPSRRGRGGIAPVVLCPHQIHLLLPG